MKFVPKKTKEKVTSVYKTLYIREELVSEIERIAKENNTSIVELTIHEGKNHQVKRMFEAVDKEVLKLKRERIAFLDLRGLNSGEYRKLSHKEVSKLYVLAK